VSSAHAENTADIRKVLDSMPHAAAPADFGASERDADHRARAVVYEAPEPVLAQVIDSPATPARRRHPNHPGHGAARPDQTVASCGARARWYAHGPMAWWDPSHPPFLDAAPA